MDGFSQGLTLTITGIVIGYISNFLLAKFNARNELKKSITQIRADKYIDLWKLCEKNLDTFDKQQKRFVALQKWYTNGGGLLLSFKATDRLLAAINLLSIDDELNPKQIQKVYKNLTWLRTEMKYEVGSYSRKEANKQLPSTK